MSQAPGLDPAPLPVSLAQRIDKVCDRFEGAWKNAGSADRRPRIEDYLGDTPQPDRSALVRELILLEVEYRCRAGDHPGSGTRPPGYCFVPLCNTGTRSFTPRSARTGAEWSRPAGTRRRGFGTQRPAAR
jgi:hypothetical protein